MKVIARHEVLTSSTQETIELKTAAGTPVPFAYHINAGNFGFAKFKVDTKSLAAFEKQLVNVEDSMSRRHIYSVLFDMIKDNDISGAQVLEIACKNIANEEAVDVPSAAPLSWNEFRVKNKGQGYSMTELAEMYRDRLLQETAV